MLYFGCIIAADGLRVMPSLLAPYLDWPETMENGNNIFGETKLRIPSVLKEFNEAVYLNMAGVQTTLPKRSNLFLMVSKPTDMERS
jgi:hypothetical protein